MAEQQLSLFERLAFSTIRIECDLASGGKSTGTGFFFQFVEDVQDIGPVIITNKHVIAGSATGHLLFTLLGPDGRPDVGNLFRYRLSDFEGMWAPHPDPDIDLCMCPIAGMIAEANKRGHAIAFGAFNWSMVPTDSEIDEYPGMEQIVMIGYPNGIWDRKHNFPVMRSGVAATHYRYDWNGKPEFLIDCACFPGSSGSPVVLADAGMVYTRHGIQAGQTRLKLLGVLYAGPVYRLDGELQIVPTPTADRVVAVTEMPNNLGMVIKAKKLHELHDVARSLRDAERAATGM